MHATNVLNESHSNIFFPKQSSTLQTEHHEDVRISFLFMPQNAHRQLFQQNISQHA
ncbi:hypothetical protein WN48_06752 [Eufriesea mexicana]|uniref:Uncharacterized protein n=1 Tax=Eufriesea mexicana TaxID=516756 RepID=A0A310SJW6_9HYME|nr:hypothetical protein WN48_06752 [Eufriesea mexicana]